MDSRTQHQSLRVGRARAGVLLAALLLAACAAPAPLQRPEPGFLSLGRTSMVDVTSRLGSPASKKILQFKDRPIESVSYAYTDPGAKGHPPKAESVRALYLYFDRGTLVGYNYVSSFWDDHTDFDETGIAELVEGRSRRADVEARIGQPTGESAYPLTKSPELTDLVYNYVRIMAQTFGPAETTSKTLVISVDSGGVVRAIKYRKEDLR